MSKTKSFEEAMQELDSILVRLSSNDVTLDESVDLYAKAALLLKTSNDKLAKAKIKISEIDRKLNEVGESG